MSDIVHALPTFDVSPYSHLLHSIEKNDITVADLLTLDPLEIARRCPLPLLEVKRLVKDVIEACQKDAGICPQPHSTSDDLLPSSSSRGVKQPKWHDTDKTPHMIRIIDPPLDAALSGGIHTGYVTEVAGESAAGKTQFCLSLLLSAQLPAPHGLSRSSIYISTESPLNTTRLHQILTTHPFYASLPPSSRPTLDNIHTIPVNDLEAQDHILTFQLPLAVRRFNAGLVIIDSVAANYRAEHSTSSSAGLAERAAELAKLGSLLRRIAREENVAVVVTNQVSDRFDDPSGREMLTQELMRGTAAATSSPEGTPAHPDTHPHLDTIMSLDYQSRFFTGWGNASPSRSQRSQPHREDLKTPALGLAWANQIAARIVLKMEVDRRVGTASQFQFQPADPAGTGAAVGGNLYHDRRKRRYMHVVFCPWAPGTDRGLEYEIREAGIVSVRDEVEELLDERLWGLDGTVDGEDGKEEEEEYPL
jgi:DNA repair protein RAD57